MQLKAVALLFIVCVSSAQTGPKGRDSGKVGREGREHFYNNKLPFPLKKLQPLQKESVENSLTDKIRDFFGTTISGGVCTVQEGLVCLAKEEVSGAVAQCFEAADRCTNASCVENVIGPENSCFSCICVVAFLLDIPCCPV